MASLKAHILNEINEIRARLDALVETIGNPEEERRARLPLEEWAPCGEEQTEMCDRYSITDAEFARELQQFKLRNMADGRDPKNRKAAFEGWLARLATLNHKPKPPPAIADAQPVSASDRRAFALRTIAFYRKIGRDEDADELEREINAST